MYYQQTLRDPPPNLCKKISSFQPLLLSFPTSPSGRKESRHSGSHQMLIEPFDGWKWLLTYVSAKQTSMIRAPRLHPTLPDFCEIKETLYVRSQLSIHHLNHLHCSALQCGALYITEDVATCRALLIQVVLS